jgi:shikimate kinase
MPLPPPPPPPFLLPRPLVLVGMMGAGKSSTGRKVAEKLACPFYDCDWEIEQRTGMAIRHYFSAHGEAAFRQLEEKVVVELMAKTPPGIIAAGGGTFIQPGAREAIQKNAISVWLKAGLETLAGRIMGPQLANRPLLANSDDPKAVLARLLTEREPLYGQAHITIVVDGLRADAVAEAVLKLVGDTHGVKP